MDQNGLQLLLITWFFTVFALAILIVKTWARFRLIRMTGIEDVVTGVTGIIVLIVAVLISNIVNIQHRNREGNVEDPGRNLSAIHKNEAAVWLGFFAASLPNFAVAMALDRVVDPRRWQKWILYGVPTVQFTSMIVSIALNGVAIRCLWSIAPSKTCPDVAAILRFNIFNAALSAFTHAFLAVVPIAAFWRLPLPPKKKIGLCLLMGTNWLAAVCLVIRNVIAAKVKSYSDRSAYLVLLWLVIEANVVLVAACIPSLRPFIISMRQTFRKKKSTSYLKRLGLHRRSNNSDPETLVQESGHTFEQPKEEHFVPAESRISVRGSVESFEQLDAGHGVSAEQEDQSHSRSHR